MGRRPWVIPPIWLAGVGAALSGYTFCAWWWGFDWLGVPTPNKCLFDHAVREVPLLWFLSCLAIGWLRYVVRPRPAGNAAIWPLLVVPIVLGLAWAGSEALEGWQRWMQWSRYPVRGPLGTADFMIPAIGVALPLVQAAVLAVFLAVQARVWRLPFVPGVCPACQYDLRGNASGRCPECGQRIVEDPAVPAWLYRSRYRLLPELGLVSDPVVRKELCEEANRAYQRSNAALFLKIAFLAFVACFGAAQIGHWETMQLAVMAAVVPVFLAAAAAWYASTRRELRRGLRARGLCELCGRSLVAGRCADCAARG